MVISVFSGSFKLKKWQKGETFSSYLRRHNIDSTKFYSQINPDDIKFLSSIQAGNPFFEDSDGLKLKEALIPLGEEMQIYIFKKKDGYGFDIIPIKYKTIKDTVSVKIKDSCFADIKKATNNPGIATHLKNIFKNYVDFTKLKKGDIVSLKYEQKSIKGIAWGEPKILGAYIKSGKNQYFAYPEGEKYNIWSNTKEPQIVKTYKTVVKKTPSKYKAFRNPLRVMRITSRFTYKRWHPILHRYRPHLGIDIGAKKGTPIHAVADGKVVFAGWMRGYGRVTKISHGGGYVSLYAHQSRQLVRAGQIVKAGQTIGRVGSTGISTGPHLHLGIYKKGRPINPFRVLHKIVLIQGGSTIYKKVVINVKNIQKKLPSKEKKLYNSLANLSNTKPFYWKDIKDKINIKIKREIKNASRIKLSSKKGAA